MSNILLFAFEVNVYDRKYNKKSQIVIITICDILIL